VEAVYPASCTPSTRKTCNQATSIRDARGNWTEYTYYADSGLVAAVTAPANNVISSRGLFESVRAQTRYSYGEFQANYKQVAGGPKTLGTKIWLKTAEKYCINSNYSGGACEGGDEVTATFEYDSDNLLLTETVVTAQGTAGSLRTCFQYDFYGNQIGKIEPNANLADCPSARFADPPTSIQSETAYLHATRYNIGGQVTGTIAPDPDGPNALRLKATRNSYGTAGDNRALLTKIESGELASFPNENIDPSAWGNSGFTIFSTKEFTYDGYGRKITESIKGSDGITESLIQYSYDAQNRIDCKAVRMNKSAFTALPSSACTLAAEGSFGPDRITKYTYDGLDQVLTEKRALGVTGLEQTYVTNTYWQRQLTSQKDANGNLTTLEYDTYGRLKKRIYPSPTMVGVSNTNDYNEYGYDANGNLNYERKRNGTSIGTTFDTNNRPTFKNLSDNAYSADTCTSFDLRGHVTSSRFAACPTSLQSPLGLGISNAFDGFGRLTGTTNDMGGFSRTLTFEYDKNGNRTRVTHPGGSPFFQYHFDALNRVADVKENDLTTLMTVSYRPSGQRLSLTRGNGVTTTYTPDAANRLGSLFHDFPAASNDLTNQFSYNSANQIWQLVQSNNTYAYTGNSQLPGSYTPNGLNQFVTASGYTATYDANANLTGYAGQGFTYDMENRLVATTAPASTLKYDPLGRLFEYTPPAPGQITQFLYAGDALVAEYTISGSTSTQTRRYVHGDRVDEPWVQYNVSSGNVRRYLHADHQGSIIAHSDDGAAVTNKLTYDAYGIPASSNVDRFAYTGQTWLKELGIFHYKARVYSPKLGRFLQSDPIGYKDDFNLYAYVGNDPFNKSDPTGMIEDSESNKIKRARLAVNAAAQKGSTDWELTRKTDDTPADQNKCSEFVNDMAEISGMPMTVKHREKGKPTIERRPTAGEMANRKGDPVKDWRRLDPSEKPLPGDIAAYASPGGGIGGTGHTGVIIMVPGGEGVSNISAHSSAVYTLENQFGEVEPDPTTDNVYLRYTGN
jgi:RHS repeat-associated protein